MRLLLDTHVLLWALALDPRLGPRARVAIESEAEAVHVSMASIWEVAIKSGIGKLDADPAEIAGAIEASGFVMLPIRLPHLLAVHKLPQREGHRDPFDRLLVAQAREEGLTLVSRDARLSGYGVAVMPCG